MNGNACCDLSKDELQCRICAEYISDKNDVVNIFDEDAKCNHLQTKIRKYLYILVSHLNNYLFIYLFLLL